MLYICLYLHTKLKVSNVILTSFKQDGGLPLHLKTEF